MSLARCPVAIIGLSCLLPGARNVRDFWDNVVGGVDCITDVPPSRWNVDDYYDPDPSAPDHTYARRGGFIPDVEFDPMEFGLPPTILEVTDVSQLLGLVLARQAFRDAGYGDGREFDRTRTSVVLGVGGGQKLVSPLTARLQYPVWERVLRASGLSETQTQAIVERLKLAYVPWEENSFPGLLGNVIAGRIANRLDLGGMNCVVDAACASSLAALRMAVDDLTGRRADMVLTGGVDTDNSPFMFLCFSKTPAFSRQQQSRPFDADSDGIMIGEGIGMLVLKRLADAERDGDRIYAVIRGLGASSDGRYRSIYAPRTEGQALALERAYADAECSPASVGLIEAHGTGTIAGDLCEFSTLDRVFSAADARRQRVALGTVKSQIGHTKAAAGAASLIKTALALHHRILPPTINVTTPNPRLGIESSAFYLNTEATPWIAPESVARRAGVSSFGFGGTNYHVVLEEHGADHQGAYRLHRTPRVCLLSGDDPVALLGACRDALASLRSDGEQALVELSASSRQQPAPPEARLGFVAANADEAAALLEIAVVQLGAHPDAAHWEHPRGIYYRRQALHPGGKVVALYPGQGAQYLDMGRELFLNFPQARAALAAMDRLFQADGLTPLSEVWLPGPGALRDDPSERARLIQRTDYAQAAIGVLSLALTQILQQAGFEPDIVAGHSFGELTALWAAGALEEADFLTLVRARGGAMAAQPTPGFDAGALLAVDGDATSVEGVLTNGGDVQIANLNGPRQVVLGGSVAAIERAEGTLAAHGLSTTRLPVSAAFHTPLVAHAREPFAAAIRSVPFQSPVRPVYANASGRPYPLDPSAVQARLAEHLSQPVRFAAQIEQIAADGGKIFVEIGPRAILTGLVRTNLGSRADLTVALNPSRRGDSDRQLREAVAQLRVAGLLLGGFDPYQLDPVEEQRSGRGVTVVLNGSNYVSPGRREAFERALQEAAPVQPTQVQPTQVQPTQVQPTQVQPTQMQPTQAQPTADRPGLARPPESSATEPSSAPARPAPPAEPPHRNGRGETAAPASPSGSLPLDLLLQSVSQTLSQLAAHQQESLRVHQQYLQNQTEYTRAFFSVVQRQQDLLLGPRAAELPPGALDHLRQGLTDLHQHQRDTLRTHEQYLAEQTEQSRALFELARDYHARLLGGQAVAPALAAPRSRPRPELAPPASAVEPWAPLAPAVEAWAPPAVPAPAGSGRSPFQTIADGEPALPRDTAFPGPYRQAPGGVDGVSNGDAHNGDAHNGDAYYGGYPSPTWMPTQAAAPSSPVTGSTPPSAPPPGHALLAPAYTPPAPAYTPPDATVAFSAPAFAPPVPASMPPAAPTLDAASPAAEAVDAASILQALTTVVADKTGYPAEMLEADMDVEADLGIDSIKRVEILAAMRALYPSLPRLKPEELAELRTLGQIAAHLAQLLGPAEPPAPSAAQPAPSAAQPAPSAAQPAPSAAQPAPSAAQLARPITAPPSQVNAPAEAALLHRQRVELATLPPPDRLVLDPAPGRVCLLIDDGTGLGAEVARRLGARGWPLVVLGGSDRGAEYAASSVARYPLPPADDASIAALLRAIEERHGPIAVVVSLAPPSGAPVDGRLVDEHERAALERVFVLAKHVKGQLTESAHLGRAAFVAVARLDGRLGLGGNGTTGPGAGGLFGLVKSLRLEWPAVACRAVDLSPDLPPNVAASLLLAELDDSNRLLAEVGHGPAG